MDKETGLPKVRDKCRQTNCDYELHISSEDIFNVHLLPHFMGHVHIDPKLSDPTRHLFWINRKNKNPANQVQEINDLDSEEEDKLSSTQGLNLNESQLVRLEMELLSKGLLKEKPKKATSRKIELIEEEPGADDEIKEEPGAEDKIKEEPCSDDKIQEDPDADQDITEILLGSDSATPEDILNQTQGIFATQHFMDPIHRNSDPFSQSILEMNSENVAANMKISKEEDEVKKEADDLSARIENCQVENSSSDEVFDSDDKWDSEDENDAIWNQNVEKRDSDDLEQILEDLDDKKEECESTDPERMSVDTTEEKVLEEPGPSSPPRKRKHLKIKEEKQKRAAFLESSVIILLKMERYLKS